ncbi:hypothetical protein JAAARDRAFT_488256 [Jaapia argillacea MUCL 33604]|uniref:Uncharacterized protein n=1 Tax=Jaapia argillacea MUCL 33604 TaxID=933084 RepID=A0A067PC09_9AGAM|nr:hypothetical protein JAAARDRAFT_488256 [Jaapia argillacea MUCL 33604]
MRRFLSGILPNGREVFVIWDSQGGWRRTGVFQHIHLFTSSLVKPRHSPPRSFPCLPLRPQRPLPRRFHSCIPSPHIPPLASSQFYCQNPVPNCAASRSRRISDGLDFGSEVGRGEEGIRSACQFQSNSLCTGTPGFAVH